ncbi:Receptor-type tyrosine-protein phosphatase F, partial [Geodia barretti]
TPAPSPPSNVRVSQNGLNSLLVTWTPSAGPNVTGYTIYYQQIDGRQNGSVKAVETDTSIVITGLTLGANFSISVVTNSSTLPSIVTYGPNVTIQQKAPSGSPEMLHAVPGEREVEFSWSPPPVTQRNGVITSYTLSCSPSPSSLPHSPSSQSGPHTVAGFSPNTHYSCSLVAS